MSDDSAPEVIGGRYETVRLIGRGGMGSVWLAKDTLLGREVAVKRIASLPGESELETERALREARSTAALNHPNVIALYDAIEHEGAPWLVMEYVAGPTLSAWVRDHGPMDPESAAEVGARLAGGLTAAHRAGVVHRDIKPANVFMADDGEPKIGDFGTARSAAEDQVTMTGVVTGTPSYMAPEVADGGEHRESADVWALGATLYFAVEGEAAYPATGNALATLRAIATQPPRAPQRAGELEPLLAKMLAHDPERRGTMSEARRSLEAIAPGRPGAIPLVGAGAGAGAGAGVAAASTPDDEATDPGFVVGAPEDESGLFGFPGVAPSGPGRKRRGTVLAGALAVVLVTGIGVAAFTLGGDDDEATPTTTSRSLTPTSETPTETSTPTSSTSETTSETTTEEPEPEPPPEPEPEPEPEPPSETTSVPPPPPPETTSEPPPSTSESTSETSEPTSEPTTDDPTSTDDPTDEPTDDPTTSDPTDDPTDDPTTSDPTDDPTTSDPTDDDPTDDPTPTSSFTR